MSEKKAPNYSEAQTDELVTAYESCVDADERAEVVENFSVKFAKGVRSIRQKLVREGVYIKKVYKAKSGDKVETKDAIVVTIAKILEVTEAQLGGLANATKPALELIRTAFLTAQDSLAVEDAAGSEFDPEAEYEKQEAEKNSS